MATVILDVTTFPQTFTAGNFPITTLNDGKYGFTPTLTLASTNAAWSTGGVAYFALLTCNDAGGLWLYCDGSGNNIHLALFDTTGATIVDVVVADPTHAWSAGATPRVVVDNVTDKVTLTGWPLGNGDTAFTGSTSNDSFATAPLGVGVYGGGGFTWSGSMSDIDDDATGVTLAADAGSFTLTGSAAGLKVAHRLVAGAGSFSMTGTAAALTLQTSLTLLGVFSASMIPALWWDRTLSPPAWFATEAAAAPPSPGAYTLAADAGSFALAGTAAGLRASRLLGAAAGSYALTGANAALVKVRSLGAGAGSYTLTGTDAGFRRALRLVAGSGAFTLTGSNAALTASGLLTLGAHGIDYQPNPYSTRDSALTLDTQASGSIVILSSGGITSDVNNAYTDNKSNTLVKIGSTTNYTDWGSTYAVALGRVKPPMTGGTSHTFGQVVAVGGEATFFAIEVIGGGRVVGYSWVNTSNTGAGSTVTTGTVTVYEPVVWLSFWWGASTVVPPYTTPFTASAAGDGFTDLDSYLVNLEYGEVQAASAALVDNTPTVASPVTRSVTWSHSPNQGAQVILIAIAAPARLTADGGSFAMTGSSATLRRTIIMPAAAGSFTLTGSAATLRRATTLGAGAGTYALTGTAAGLRVTRKLTAEAGSFTATGTAATMRYVRALAAGAGSFTLTGAAAALKAARALAAGVGAFAVTGTAAGLKVTHRLFAGAGAFTATGSAAGLTLARKLSAGAGSFSTTGSAAGLARTVRLVAAGGSFVLTGGSATLRASRALTAAAGAFALSGSTAGLRLARRLAADAGAYELAGADAALTYQTQARVSAESGAFTLAGTEAALAYARRLVAGAGAFSLTGAATSLLLARQIAALAGAYTLTGLSVELTVQSGLAPLPHGSAYALARTTAAPALVRTTTAPSLTRTTAAPRLTRTT